MIAANAAANSNPATRTLTASCSSGKVALGGGGNPTVADQGDVFIQASYPTNLNANNQPTGWTVQAKKINTGADQNWGLNIHVICGYVLA